MVSDPLLRPEKMPRQWVDLIFATQLFTRRDSPLTDKPYG